MASCYDRLLRFLHPHCLAANLGLLKFSASGPIRCSGCIALWSTTLLRSFFQILSKLNISMIMIMAKSSCKMVCQKCCSHIYCCVSRYRYGTSRCLRHWHMTSLLLHCRDEPLEFRSSIEIVLVCICLVTTSIYSLLVMTTRLATLLRIHYLRRCSVTGFFIRDT